MQKPSNDATMSVMKDKEPHKPAIQVLERSFALFDVLAAHQDPVPLKQISAQTGLHPSTAHRILNDLAVGGARPLWLAAAFILEEGLSLSDLQRIVQSMRQAPGAR